MVNQLILKDIVLLGRSFDEYFRMFDLNNEFLENELILDVASGVSSFCAEANEKGYNVTASDRIYTYKVSEIEDKCLRDLDTVIRQLPGVAHLYIWDYFKDIRSLKNQRVTAFKSFIEDFKKTIPGRYVPVEYPVTDFQEDKFTISLVSHFLFLYDDKLDYDIHRRTINELLRITTKEIRIFPIVNLKGERSVFVEKVLQDQEFGHLDISIKRVDYEFMKNANEMMVMKKGAYDRM